MGGIKIFKDQKNFRVSFSGGSKILAVKFYEGSKFLELKCFMIQNFVVVNFLGGQIFLRVEGKLFHEQHFLEAKNCGVKINRLNYFIFNSENLEEISSVALLSPACFCSFFSDGQV